jgi:transcriptional regulator GlxA family with amidase domain
VLDAFGTANTLAEMTGVSSLRFQMKVVGLHKSITTARGLSLPVMAAARAQTPDAVVMPAILYMRPAPLVQALAGSEVREAGAVLRKWSGRGALTATACIGTFVKALATSKRTLARRMQSVLGKSPLAFFQDLRVERAVHLLRTSHASVDQIAAKVGYAEGVTLRALLRRKLGRGVHEIRRSL